MNLSYLSLVAFQLKKISVQNFITLLYNASENERITVKSDLQRFASSLLCGREILYGTNNSKMDQARFMEDNL